NRVAVTVMPRLGSTAGGCGSVWAKAGVPAVRPQANAAQPTCPRIAAPSRSLSAVEKRYNITSLEVNVRSLPVAYREGRGWSGSEDEVSGGPAGRGVRRRLGAGAVDDPDAGGCQGFPATDRGPAACAGQAAGRSRSLFRSGDRALRKPAEGQERQVL